MSFRPEGAPCHHPSPVTHTLTAGCTTTQILLASGLTRCDRYPRRLRQQPRIPPCVDARSVTKCCRGWLYTAIRRFPVASQHPKLSLLAEPDSCVSLHPVSVHTHNHSATHPLNLPAHSPTHSLTHSLASSHSPSHSQTLTQPHPLNTYLTQLTHSSTKTRAITTREAEPPSERTRATG